MKKFFVAGVLGALLCALPLIAQSAPKPDAIKAPVKVPLVTRDNFVSLEFTNTDKLGEYESQFFVAGNQLRMEETALRSIDGLFSDGKTLMGTDTVEILDAFKERTSSQPVMNILPGESDDFSRFNPPFSNASKSVGVSSKQIEILIGELNKTVFTKVASSVSRNRLVGDQKYAVWLVINDEQGRDQIYTSAYNGNYFEAAPFNLINYLYYFQKTKFPDGSRLWAQQYVPFTSSYFQSLTLETSGGIEGKHFVARVRAVAQENHLQWSQSTDGKNFSQDKSLGPVGTWAFFRALNQAKIPSLNGKSYKQLNLTDGIKEVLTLTLSDGRTFTFSNYGNHAPKGLAYFVDYLKNPSGHKD